MSSDKKERTSPNFFTKTTIEAKALVENLQVVCTNGTLATKDKPLELRDAGLDEIRLGIGAVQYSLLKKTVFRSVFLNGRLGTGAVF